MTRRALHAANVTWTTARRGPRIDPMRGPDSEPRAFMRETGQHAYVRFETRCVIERKKTLEARLDTLF